MKKKYYKKVVQKRKHRQKVDNEILKHLINMKSKQEG